MRGLSGTTMKKAEAFNLSGYEFMKRGMEAIKDGKMDYPAFVKLCEAYISHNKNSQPVTPEYVKDLFGIKE